jgi:hypothetical protein
VLIFCERLRLARGQQLRSRYPAALLSAEPAYQQLAAKLNEKTTFTFLPWSRLADVVRHWEDTSGLTILVDWSSLAEAEMSPSSPIACSANHRNWSDVLDGSLEPIDLAWWPVNKDTIQITTAEAIDDVQRIEFYAIPKSMRERFASDDALIESLQNGLHTGESGSGMKSKQPTMILDDTSGRLIVLGTPKVHRVLSQHIKP